MKTTFAGNLLSESTPIAYNKEKNVKVVIDFFRLVKTATVLVTLNLYLKKSDGTVVRLLTPGFVLTTDVGIIEILEEGQSIVLENGDTIYASCSPNKSLDYWVTGNSENI